MDLASHMLVGESMVFSGKEGGGSERYNLGNGNGFSVREVFGTVARVTGLRIVVCEQGRRTGDPPSLVADASLARRQLGWEPRFSSLDDIIALAWSWEQQHFHESGCSVVGA